MSVLDESLKRIQQKLQQILKQQHLLQKENEQLRAAVKFLQEGKENDTKRIMELEQLAGILKSAAGKMDEPDKKLFEKHINQYIKDIDKCIGLLSE